MTIGHGRPTLEQRSTPMGIHVERYTKEQREAIGVAYVDLGVRPAQRVAAMAAAGELMLDGQRLDPFETNASTVRDCSRKIRLRRAGQLRRELATLQPRDQLEALRVRLVALADREISYHEKQPRGKVKSEELRQYARVLREIAAIPGPTDPRPAAPGQKIPGTQVNNGERTTGGLAGKALAASRRSSPAQIAPGPPGQDAHLEQDEHGESTARSEAASEQDRLDNSTGEGTPGSWAQQQADALTT